MPDIPIPFSPLPLSRSGMGESSSHPLLKRKSPRVPHRFSPSSLPPPSRRPLSFLSPHRSPSFLPFLFPLEDFSLSLRDERRRSFSPSFSLRRFLSCCHFLSPNETNAEREHIVLRRRRRRRGWTNKHAAEIPRLSPASLAASALSAPRASAAMGWPLWPL